MLADGAPTPAKATVNTYFNLDLFWMEVVQDGYGNVMQLNMIQP